MSKVLVTGGCGYIGSHTIVDLVKKGYDVVSVDNFINGDPKILNGVNKICGKEIKNYEVDLCNQDATLEIFEKEENITDIIHFAALKSVGDSVQKPLRYFENNINALLNVLVAAKKFKVKNFVFSSSCTVYGEADQIPVTEESPIKPAVSPYGLTKQIGEQIIEDSVVSLDLKVMILRYFNPAGAHPSNLIGESSINPSQNLVPIITETAIGKREKMSVFGTNYDTRDGTCIRDYIHVVDVADAHTKSLDYLSKKPEIGSTVLNLGIGKGVTVLEMIRAFEEVSSQTLNYQLSDRREGDVSAIYANPQKALQILNWEPKYNLKEIMKTAWEWEKNKMLK